MNTERTEILIGKDGVKKLTLAHVAVFGAGGVGSYAIEALARTGVGEITVVDFDTVDESNINRQLIALYDTVGKNKTDVVKQRVFSINPECKINVVQGFYSEENPIELKNFDVIIDAIDSLKSKVFLIKSAKACGAEIISAMGTGNRLDPTKLTVCDIYDTSGCPLARKVRSECRRAQIDSLKVVCSTEEPVKSVGVIGSMTFVPGVAGLTCAYEAVKFILSEN